MFLECWVILMFKAKAHFEIPEHFYVVWVQLKEASWRINKFQLISNLSNSNEQNDEFALQHFAFHLKDRSGQTSSELKQVQLPVASDDDCKRLYGSNRVDLICAGGAKGEDTCDGDGGGPLMCREKNGEEKFVQVCGGFQ